MHRPATTATASKTDGSKCQACPFSSRGLCALLIKEGLSGEVRHRGYQRRTTLAMEGEPVRYAYILRSGVVSVSRNPKGKPRHLMDFLMAGDVSGLSDETVATTTLTALEDTEVCQIPISLFQQAERSNSFLRGLILLVEQAMIRVHDQIVLLGKLKAEERVVAFLLRYRAARQRIQAMQARLDLPMTRRDIADHLGMAPETVSRALSWLQQKQLVVTIPDGIRVLDLVALEELSRRHLQLERMFASVSLPPLTRPLTPRPVVRALAPIDVRPQAPTLMVAAAS